MEGSKVERHPGSRKLTWSVVGDRASILALIGAGALIWHSAAHSNSQYNEVPGDYAVALASQRTLTNLEQGGSRLVETQVASSLRLTLEPDGKAIFACLGVMAPAHFTVSLDQVEVDLADSPAAERAMRDQALKLDSGSHPSDTAFAPEVIRLKRTANPTRLLLPALTNRRAAVAGMAFVAMNYNPEIYLERIRE